MTILMSPISGRIVGRAGPRPSLCLGGIGIATGSFLLTGLTPTTSFSRLFVAYVIFGIGFGVVNAPITNTAVSGMPASRAGVASAVASTSRQVGQSLGVAMVGALAAAGLVDGAVSSGFSQATHAGWWLITSCGVFVLLLGIVTTTKWARGTAVRTAQRFGLDEAQAAVSVVPTTA